MTAVSVRIRVPRSGLLARIAGGQRTQSMARTLVLDASASFDLDDPAPNSLLQTGLASGWVAQLDFSWACVDVSSGASCFAATLAGSSTNRVDLSPTDLAAATPGAMLRFSVSIRSTIQPAAGNSQSRAALPSSLQPAVTASATATILLSSAGEIPDVQVSSVRNGARYASMVDSVAVTGSTAYFVNPTEPVLIQTSAQTTAGRVLAASEVAYTWSMVDGDLPDDAFSLVAWSQWFLSKRGSPSLVIRPSVLSPGAE